MRQLLFDLHEETIFDQSLRAHVAFADGAAPAVGDAWVSGLFALALGEEGFEIEALSVQTCRAADGSDADAIVSVGFEEWYGQGGGCHGYVVVFIWRTLKRALDCCERVCGGDGGDAGDDGVV